jgi:hypothetical protein
VEDKGAARRKGEFEGLSDSVPASWCALREVATRRMHCRARMRTKKEGGIKQGGGAARVGRVRLNG